MSLNLTNLFTALGRIGRNAYMMEAGQDAQSETFTSLAASTGLNPEWTASLALTYDGELRGESSVMASWSNTAQTILQSMVAADAPTYGTSLSASLTYLLNQMAAQSASVAECTVTASASAYPDNVGTGVVFITLQRGDGLILQNTIAESSTLLITTDSYTGNATAGQEPWTWTGAPNNSSLGTGTPVGLWDWDWPQGSGAAASGSCISAAQDASTTGNILTNGDFESWTGSAPAVLDYWYLQTGTWGSSIERASGGVDAAYCVQFNTGATLNALTQQFGSTTSDGTVATAGTQISLSGLRSFCGCLFLKAAGVISAGVLTIELVDGSNTVIADQQGTNNTTTISLAAHPTSWTAHTYGFRLPAVLPAIIRLRVRISTALAGAALLMDWATFTVPVNLYRGGPSLAVFSDPANPFEANPEADGFTLVTTNDRAGAYYGATWQTLLNRLYQTPDFLAPYSATPTIADSLITGPRALTLHGPISIAVNTNGAAVDVSTLPYSLAFVLEVGAMAATTLAVTIEESATGLGSWTTLVTFSTLSAGSTRQVAHAIRTQPWLRAVYTMTGAAATLVGVTAQSPAI